MSDLQKIYAAARSQLVRARPTSIGAAEQYRRRIERHPLPALEAMPAIAGVLGDSTDEDDDGGQEGGNDVPPQCLYNLPYIINATCGQFDLLAGDWECAPPYMRIPVSGAFGGADARYNAFSDYQDISVYSEIWEGTDGGEIVEAGVYLRGTSISDSIYCAYNKPAGKLYLYENGVFVAESLPVAFVEGGELSVTVNGGTLYAYYPGLFASLLWPFLTILDPGYVGLGASSKGHYQTLTILDQRCSGG